MGYSIIIPYRDRQTHLEILLPALFEKFKDEEYEIIVSEQDDNESFSSAALYNIGFLQAQYDTLVLHVVDYVPTEDVSYKLDGYDCVLPVRRGIFLDKDNANLRPIYDVPGGYRKWIESVDDNFFGAVVVIKTIKFDKIKGFNPLYKAWGKEDDDLGLRVRHHGLKYKRNEQGTFYCLYHLDNGDPNNNKEEHLQDFRKNEVIYSQYDKFLDYGYMNLKFESKKEIINIQGKDIIWIKSNKFEVTE